VLGLGLLRDRLEDEQCEVTLVRVLAAKGDDFFDRIHPASVHCVEGDESDTHAEAVDDDALTQTHLVLSVSTLLGRSLLRDAHEH